MKNKVIKVLFIAVLCMALLVGCVVTPTSTPTPIPTPSPTPDNEILDIVIGMKKYVNDAEKRFELMEKILLEKFKLNVVDYVNYDSGEKMDVIFKPSPGDTNLYTDDNRAMATAKIVEDSFKFGIKHNVVNYLDYLDKMPNYTSRFHRKDIYITQLYEDSSFASPYAVDGWMFDLPLVGGFEGEPQGVWMYNKNWFSFNVSEPVEDMDIEKIIDTLIAYSKKNSVSSLVLSDVTDTENGVGISPLLTGIAASLGVDVDFLNEIMVEVDSYDSSEWQSRIISMLTFNEEGKLEFTLNSDAYLKALELYRKLVDSGIVDFLPSGSISKEEIDNYLVAYVPMDYCYDNGAQSIFDGKSNILLSRDLWYCAENQFSADENVYINTIGDTTQNVGAGVYVIDNGNDRVINRLISFIDWCCSEEGIFLMNYGEENVDWEYDYNNELRLKTFNTRFVNLARFDTEANIKWAGNSPFQPVSIDEVSRLMAHRVSSFEYRINNSVFDMTKYNAYADYKLNTAIGKKNVVYVESPDPTLFSMEVSSTDQANEMYLPIKNVIGIVTDFYEGFISGKLNSADFNGYCSALDEAGIDNIIDYIEGVYENAFSKYGAPDMLS